MSQLQTGNTQPSQHVTREFFKVAQEVVQDGQINAVDLGRLKAAAKADGEITEAEIQLIANLDNVEVQKAVLQQADLSLEVRFVELGVQMDRKDRIVNLGSVTADLSQDPEFQAGRSVATQIHQTTQETTQLTARLQALQAQRSQLVATNSTFRAGSSAYQTLNQLNQDITALERQRDALTSRLNREQATVLQDQLVSVGPEGWKNLEAEDNASKVLRSTSTEAGAIADALLKSQTQTIDFNMESLKLDEGHNLIYAMVLMYGHKAEEQPHLSQVQDVLQNLLSGQADTVGARYQELNPALQRFGIQMNPEGQLINMKTRQALDTESLTALLDTVSGMQTAFRSGSTSRVDPKQNVVLNHWLGVMTNAGQRLTQLGELRQELTRETELLDEATQDLEHQEAALAQQTEQVTRRQAEVDDKAQEVEALTIFTPENLRDSQAFAESLAIPGQLEKYNATLEKYGLQISRDPQTGEIQYLQNGEEVSQEAFFAALSGLVQQEREALVALEANLTQEQAHLDALRQSTADQKEVVTGLQGKVKELLDKYKQELLASKQSVEELRALRNNPEAWAQIPDALKPVFEAHLAELERQLEEEQAQAPEVIAKADEAVERSEAAIEQAEATLARAAEVSHRSQELLQNLRSLVQDLSALQTGLNVLSEETQALIQEANELDARLVLCVTPDYEGIKDLAKEMQEAFAKALKLLGQLDKNSLAHTDFHERLSQDNLKKIKSSLMYHQAQLKKFDHLAKEHLAILLQDSLPHLREQLQALPL